MPARRHVIAALTLLLSAAPPSLATGEEPAPQGAPHTTEVTVPLGDAATIDGTLGDEEWADARTIRLDPAGEVHVKHDGTFLDIGVRSSDRAILSVAVLVRDTVRILHASMALGTAEYARTGTTWKRTRDFGDWRCRDASSDGPAAAERLRHLLDEGWVASVMPQGTGRDAEIRIRVPVGEVCLALTSLVPGPESAALSWPSGLHDSSSDPALVSGRPPEEARFQVDAWSRLKPEDQAETKRGGGDAPRPGEVVELTCAGDGDHRYLCRVPSGWAKEEAALRPIAYCFAPRGTERRLVEGLGAACDERGWIAVAPLCTSEDAPPVGPPGIATLIADTEARFRLAPTDRYVVGVGSAGQVAFDTVGRSPESFAGLIGIGVGAGPGRSPPREDALVCLLVGEDDPTRASVERLQARLEGIFGGLDPGAPPLERLRRVLLAMAEDAEAHRDDLRVVITHSVSDPVYLASPTGPRRRLLALLTRLLEEAATCRRAPDPTGLDAAEQASQLLGLYNHAMLSIVFGGCIAEVAIDRLWRFALGGLGGDDPPPR